jgi:two-component sensor histidine kinase/PAS domain-containing protein
MRLRARLLLLIGAALLPAVAVQVHYEREAVILREASDRADALRLARLVGADIESVIEGAEQFLAAAANLDAVVRGDATSCTRTLTELSRDVPRYATFSVTDAAGRIICAADPNSLGANVSDRDWYRRLQRGEDFALGSFAIGRGTGRPSLHVAHALRTERHGRDGAVVAALDLEWLSRRLADVPLPPGGVVFLADRAGTLLGRWPDPAGFVGSQAPPSVIQALLDRDYGASRASGIDGVQRYYALAPSSLRHPGILVGVGLDTAPVEAALAASRRQALLLTGAGALATLLLGLFVATRFMERPVEALLQAMERWRAGDAGARVGGDPRLGQSGSRGEFLRIAAAFDQAAAAVEARGLALRESEARFLQIAEAIDEALLIAEPDRHRLIFASPAAERIFGRRVDHFAAFLETVEPDQRPLVDAALSRPASQGFDIEYRTRHPDGAVRRLRHRRFPVPGSATGRVVDVVSDVTEEREVAERQILLTREVDHRAKNVLAVVQSILRLTRADSPRAFAGAVEGRVAALARAHQLLARSRWDGADLIELLQEEFAPYTARRRSRPKGPERCLLEGPPLRLGPEAVQPVAMVVHELATNSAKHGALSVPGGLLRIGWDLTPREPGGAAWLRLHWTETGGPPVPSAPARFGFGSRVVTTTVERQLGGEVTFDWAPGGLRCEIAVPAAKLLQPQARPTERDLAEPPRAGPDRQPTSGKATEVIRPPGRAGVG